MNNILFALPEMIVAGGGMILLLLGAWLGEKSMPRLVVPSFLLLVFAAFMVFVGPACGSAMNGLFVTDELARYAKLLILAASGLSLFLAPSHLRDTANGRPEYPVLILFAALGMMVMASAGNLLSLYAGLELQNLALYVLVALERDRPRASEAGLKYFILGAVSSAILLFGASLVYGSAGTLSFGQLAAGHGAGFALGVAFVVAGFAFKLAAVPFHMWAPDVYEGAPSPVTGFLLAAPKIAAMVLLARLLATGFMGAREAWQPMLAFFAVASMVLGAFGGLAQKNIKRLMAYSAITNIGVMLVGIVLLGAGRAGVDGLAGTLLYLALYLVGTLGLFAGVLMIRRGGAPIEKIDDLAGLFKSHSTLAVCLSAALFSLAGIPPLAGFFGKYNVLLAAVKGDEMTLAVIGVLASVVAAAYYLRVIKVMVFDPPSAVPSTLADDPALYRVAVFSAFAVVLFVISPAPLMNAAQEAATRLLMP